MNEKRHGPRLKARSQLLTRATRIPSVHRVRFTPARILLSVLSAFHSAQLHPADTPPFVFVSRLSSHHYDLPHSPPSLPLRLITTLIHHHRGGLLSRSFFSSFVPIFFLYPCISFFPCLSFSFVEKRKETLAFPSLSLYISPRISCILAHLFPFFRSSLIFFSIEGSIQYTIYNSS